MNIQYFMINICCLLKLNSKFQSAQFIIFIYFDPSMLKILEIQNHFPSILDTHNKENIHHNYHHYLNKQQSPLNPQDSKQKSQLCRSYMDYGFCPYEARCKFAHGSHELLKNNQVNNKYKTKQCENFKKNGCCLYGKRCNFIHVHNYDEIVKECGKQDIIFRLFRKEIQTKSKLLCLLYKI